MVSVIIPINHIIIKEQLSNIIKLYEAHKYAKCLMRLVPYNQIEKYLCYFELNSITFVQKVSKKNPVIDENKPGQKFDTDR